MRRTQNSIDFVLNGRCRRCQRQSNAWTHDHFVFIFGNGENNNKFPRNEFAFQLYVCMFLAMARTIQVWQENAHSFGEKQIEIWRDHYCMHCFLHIGNDLLLYAWVSYCDLLFIGHSFALFLSPKDFTLSVALRISCITLVYNQKIHWESPTTIKLQQLLSPKSIIISSPNIPVGCLW